MNPEREWSYSELAGSPHSKTAGADEIGRQCRQTTVAAMGRIKIPQRSSSSINEVCYPLDRVTLKGWCRPSVPTSCRMKRMASSRYVLPQISLLVLARQTAGEHENPR
jgi:hypothetical protein